MRELFPHALLALVMLTLLGASAALCSPIAAPTFQQLMDPTVFPDAQCGMRVESVHSSGDSVSITTTGAVVEVSPSQGKITFRQRIDHKRVVAVARFDSPLLGVSVTHEKPGFARIAVRSPRMTLRVNGDSLCTLHVQESMRVRMNRALLPAYTPSYQKNHLVVDEWGGFALYCSEIALDDHFDPDNETVATYKLPPDAVVCVGVCPPKPYDWQRSLRDQVVWHWSGTCAYPSDEILRSWRSMGNIVLLQSEVMLWKDWNLDFVPRLGAEEFARVGKTVHELGMRFIVYTSPYFFLKGTAQEKQAVNDRPGACPGAVGDGQNMELFMDAITRVMQDLKPDGLYFDGQYSNNPAALYALARRSRSVVGENGIMEWHSSGGLGGGLCYMPHADAYVDFILRGEGQNRMYGDLDFLRYFVSGYNVNNCIGVLCNNAGDRHPSPKLMDDVLLANARFHTQTASEPQLTAFLPIGYRDRLTPKLRQQVDRQVDMRQAKLAETTAARKAERRPLEEPPTWQKPVFEQTFAAVPDVERSVSPRNADPFSALDGALHIKAHAHTYAWLRFPLKVRASGFMVKLRQGTDGGMFWGPCALLRWAEGTVLRLGVRADQSLTVTGPAGQFDGASHDPRRWVWIRARWIRDWCVIERSTDGREFERVWAFGHDGSLNAETAELLIGKVPCSALAVDYAEPADVGECEIEAVQVYPQ